MPRRADDRVGYFSITQVNFGLDELKAAEQTFIRRWRMEPSDPEAYARGELVDPVKPIVYYIDQATPAKWRPYVIQGIEDWQAAFETAGFSNAIVALEPPTTGGGPGLGRRGRPLLGRALGGQHGAQCHGPIGVGPAHRRDHRERHRLVPQPPALLPQSADARNRGVEPGGAIARYA